MSHTNFISWCGFTTGCANQNRNSKRPQELSIQLWRTAVPQERDCQWLVDLGAPLYAFTMDLSWIHVSMCIYQVSCIYMYLLSAVSLNISRGLELGIFSTFFAKEKIMTSEALASASWLKSLCPFHGKDSPHWIIASLINMAKCPAN